MSDIIRFIIFVLFYIILIYGPLMILKKKFEKKKKLTNVESKEKLKIFSLFVLSTIVMGVINFFIIHNLNTLNSTELVSNQIKLNPFFSTLAVLLETITLISWGIIFTNTMSKLTLYKDNIFRVLSAIIFLVGYYYVFIIMLFSFFGFFVSYIYPYKFIELMAQALLFIPIITYIGVMIYKIIKE